MGITTRAVIDAPIEEVFAWHARSGALTRLLPPWQPMRPLAEATSLAVGTAMLGLPAGLRWPARHDPHAYDPPHRFVDRRVLAGPRTWPPALAGPWRHEHLFAALPGERTELTDRITAAVPAAALRATFRYRHRQLAEDLRAHAEARATGLASSTIAVTGASGLVGTALTALLTTGGHRVIRLVRGPADGADTRTWDPRDPDPALLDGVDAVIHLAGAPIFGRFSAAHRREIRDSRVGPTRLLARAAARADSGPEVFVSASAIGFYGHDRTGERLDHTGDPGTGFLAETVRDWEAAAASAADAGLRTVAVRTGIVQSPRGGVLRLQRPLFTAGLGGRLGSGRQYLSWIDIDDLVDIYLRALYDRALSGPIDAVAPGAVTAAQYARTLARVLRRPAVLPVPKAGPALLLGRRGAAELALADQHVVPTALLARGHRFRRADLEDCLRHQLGRADGDLR